MLGTSRRDNRIFITIKDSGIGILEEIRARIFDPFFTTKGVGNGTGQGLSMAHNIIVNNHHGLIGVDSIPGQGTTFTIELPIDSSELEQR
jgi:signal transduction histidine kinase